MVITFLRILIDKGPQSSLNDTQALTSLLTMLTGKAGTSLPMKLKLAKLRTQLLNGPCPIQPQFTIEIGNGTVVARRLNRFHHRPLSITRVLRWPTKPVARKARHPTCYSTNILHRSRNIKSHTNPPESRCPHFTKLPHNARHNSKNAFAPHERHPATTQPPTESLSIMGLHRRRPRRLHPHSTRKSLISGDQSRLSYEVHRSR